MVSDQPGAAGSLGNVCEGPRNVRSGDRFLAGDFLRFLDLQSKIWRKEITGSAGLRFLPEKCEG